MEAEVWPISNRTISYMFCEVSGILLAQFPFYFSSENALCKKGTLLLQPAAAQLSFWFAAVQTTFPWVWPSHSSLRTSESYWSWVFKCGGLLHWPRGSTKIIFKEIIFDWALLLESLPLFMSSSRTMANFHFFFFFLAGNEHTLRSRQANY